MNIISATNYLEDNAVRWRNSFPFFFFVNNVFLFQYLVKKRKSEGSPVWLASNKQGSDKTSWLREITSASSRQFRRFHISVSINVTYFLATNSPLLAASWIYHTIYFILSNFLLFCKRARLVGFRPSAHQGPPVQRKREELEMLCKDCVHRPVSDESWV